MLNKRQKYLQIALNSTLEEAKTIIRQIPLDERIIIEAGTPLIKNYGVEAIRKINFWWSQKIYSYDSETFSTAESPDFFSLFSGSFKITNYFYRLLIEKRKQKEREIIKKKSPPFMPYIVADLKCMDRGAREVEIAYKAGASAAVVLGQAPVETIDAFIQECEKYKIDSMIDMMNVDFPLEILRQLKKPPQVVILHRGVDEEIFNPESEIPYHEITRIKNEYDIMVAVAGGDAFQEVQRAIFNDADIVVVWKSFYQSTGETAKLVEEFLKEFR